MIKNVLTLELKVKV